MARTIFYIADDGQNSQKKKIDFAMIHGHESSYQENATFEDSMFWLNGFSAIKEIMVLKALGITIDQMEPYQTYANDGMPSAVVDDINNALNMGWKVIVPQETAGLPAVPYIKYDPETGSAGYMIASTAGGLAMTVTPTGYETDLTFIKDLFWSQLGLKLSLKILSPPSPHLVAFGEAFPVMVRATVESGTGQATVDKTFYIDTNMFCLSRKWTMQPVELMGIRMPRSYRIPDMPAAS